MDLNGDLKLRRQSNYYNDTLISLDFPRVANDEDRDLIDSPSHGDLIITLDDHSLNIYDDSLEYWKKLKCNYSLDRAIFSQFTDDQFAVNALNISVPGSYESCNGLKTNRARGTMLSNGSGDTGFICAGYSYNNSTLYTYAGSNANINLIEYIQISTTLSADIFGELSEASSLISGTSNAELNVALISGISHTSTGVCKFNMKSKAEASAETISGVLNTASYARGQYPAVMSNCTLDRAFICAPYYYGYRTNVTTLMISTTEAAEVWGALTSAMYYGSATSNGEGNRGLINRGNSDLGVDYIDLSTYSDASLFGNLIEQIQHSEATSNRTRNIAIFHCGKGTGDTYGSQIQYMDMSTLGDATLFQDLGSFTGECASCSNS